jgi:hypothetical protein
VRSETWSLLIVVPGAVVADQLREVLEGEGIPVIVQGSFLENVTLVKGLEGGRYQVYVPRGHHRRARETVAGMVDETAFAEPDTPPPAGLS